MSNSCSHFSQLLPFPSRNRRKRRANQRSESFFWDVYWTVRWDLWIINEIIISQVQQKRLWTSYNLRSHVDPYDVLRSLETWNWFHSIQCWFMVHGCKPPSIWTPLFFPNENIFLWFCFLTFYLIYLPNLSTEFYFILNISRIFSISLAYESHVLVCCIFWKRLSCVCCSLLSDDVVRDSEE